MEVIETHGHLNLTGIGLIDMSPEKVSKEMDRLKIKKFINLSFKTGYKFKDMKNNYNDNRIIHFSTFNWQRMKETEDFVPLMLNDLKVDIANGSRGIKLWKDFGLHFKKKNGERLKLNDPILDPLFQECSNAGLIISIHTGDPSAFFEPMDEKNERYEELLRRPEWHFPKEKFPALDTVLNERDALFKKFPNLIFIALHFGEYPNRLNLAEKMLSENPNVYVDIAARIDELGRQPYKARAFFQKFQDRILFGTDGEPDQGKLEIYSRFLETEDEYFDYFPEHKPRKGFWKIYGLGLEKKILEKIYYKNAERLFKR
jgi:predicted TIM-barrel fold metal-dependent hydrolase